MAHKRRRYNTVPLIEYLQECHDLKSTITKLQYEVELKDHIIKKLIRLHEQELKLKDDVIRALRTASAQTTTPANISLSDDLMEIVRHPTILKPVEQYPQLVTARSISVIVESHNGNCLSQTMVFPRL